MTKQVWLTFVASIMVIPGLADRAAAQATSPVLASSLSYSSGPVLAAPGEHILNCAGFTGTYSGKTITATLQLLNAATGAVVVQQQVTLPSSSVTTSIAEPPDPCLEFVVPARVPATASASGVFWPVYIGKVALNPQPLPPGIV